MSSAPRRPAPKRPIGGGSLLDNILSKTTKLHSSVRNTRVGDDTNEVATPYMMSRSACAPSSLVVCRMPECTPPGQSAVFDIDMRHGDRVCVRCGTVQNSRSIESQEEEHRTFADDDKAESKKRAEINDGKQGGRTGDKSLGAAMGIANAEPGKVTLTLSLTPNLTLTLSLTPTLTLTIEGGVGEATHWRWPCHREGEPRAVLGGRARQGVGA